MFPTRDDDDEDDDDDDDDDEPPPTPPPTMVEPILEVNVDTVDVAVRAVASNVSDAASMVVFILLAARENILDAVIDMPFVGRGRGCWGGGGGGAS